MNETTQTQSTPAEILDRLPALTSRLDMRIEQLRSSIASLAEGIARDAGRIAEVVERPDGRPSALGSSSAGYQLDAAIAELNALLTEREMLDYVLNGAAHLVARGSK